MFGSRRIAPSTEPEAASVPSRVYNRASEDSLRPTPVQQQRRIRRPRGGLLSLMSGLLTVAVVVAGAFVFGLLALEHEVGKPGPLPADKIVLVPKNSGVVEIGELLLTEGVISNPTLFDLYSYVKRGKGQLKAGEFVFKANTSIEGAVDTLIQGKAILHSLTIPEGLTSEQIVARLRENDVLTGDVREVPREGSLLPDTYKFDRGTTRQGLINTMQKEQRDALTRVWQKRSPDGAIKTPQELLILASIVEKETGRADERPRVASVFLNRLARRMKLQSDPTIVYGLVGGKGTLGRGITRSEIDRPSPYNTYVIEGLPPTPIANPGRAALEAVANPLKTRDIFFVADGTGGHAFAETLDQHNRNVARWRQIERSRLSAGGNTGEVDRAAPAPDNRTDLMFEPDRLPGTRPSIEARALDASEGTSRDPLRNRNWDLSSPKTVPSFGGIDPAPVPRVASTPAARRAPTRREAEVSARPPGLELPAR